MVEYFHDWANFTRSWSRCIMLPLIKLTDLRGDVGLLFLNMNIYVAAPP